MEYAATIYNIRTFHAGHGSFPEVRQGTYSANHYERRRDEWSILRVFLQNLQATLFSSGPTIICFTRSRSMYLQRFLKPTTTDLSCKIS